MSFSIIHFFINCEQIGRAVVKKDDMLIVSEYAQVAFVNMELLCMISFTNSWCGLVFILKLHAVT